MEEKTVTDNWFFSFGFDFTEIFKFLKSSAECIILWSQAPRCASHHRVKLLSLIPTAESSDHFFSQKTSWCDTAESDSTVCILPQSQAPRCALHRRVKLTPPSQNQNLCMSLVAFKGTIRRNPFMGEHIYHERKDMWTIFLIC